MSSIVHIKIKKTSIVREIIEYKLLHVVCTDEIKYNKKGQMIKNLAASKKKKSK